MTVPDIDDFNTYGGEISNYAPVEDPTTDRDAAKACQAYASTAAMTQTATRAWARMTCNTTTGTLVLVDKDGLWPNTGPNAPTLLRNGTGDFTLTWPATVTDSRGVVHTLNFRGAAASLEGTVFGFITATPASANSVRVRLANTGGAANDFAGINILVEAK